MDRAGQFHECRGRRLEPEIDNLDALPENTDYIIFDEDEYGDE